MLFSYKARTEIILIKSLVDFIILSASTDFGIIAGNRSRKKLDNSNDLENQDQVKT